MTAIEDARAALGEIEAARTVRERALGRARVEAALRALIAEHERMRGWLEEQKLGGRFGALPQFLLRVLDGEERLAVGGEGVGHEGIPGHSMQVVTAPPTDAEREAIIHALDLWDNDPTYTTPDAAWRKAAEYLHAAGFRRQGPITDEWEYGAVYQGHNGEWFSMDGAFALREAAEREVERYADAQITLGRRRKADPWEPVEAAERDWEAKRRRDVLGQAVDPVEAATAPLLSNQPEQES